MFIVPLCPRSEREGWVIAEAFLIAAMSLPATHHTRPRIVPYFTATDEEGKLIGWIRKHSPGAEVFIHPKPQEEKLREAGWERVPFTWNGKQIWIKRKPRSDTKKLLSSA